MAKAKHIKWPPPPERDALHQYLGQEAARLLAEYQRAQGKRGPGASRQKWMTKGAALDLLRATEAPPSLVGLFDVMLGGVSAELLRMEPRRPWIDRIVDYEARAHNDGREVTNAEITDHVAMPAHPRASDRNYMMRMVRQVRKTGWYPALVLSRRVYLIDNPETV